MTIATLQRNVQSVIENLNDIVIDSAMENKDSIAEFNKEQLWDGKTALGEDISPRYSEDPYFKTRQAAENYANWKQRITPNSKRNKDVPNLFINGTFYSSIETLRVGDGIINTSYIPLGRDVIAKFDNIMGLTVDNRARLAQLSLPEILKRLRNELFKS